MKRLIVLIGFVLLQFSAAHANPKVVSQSGAWGVYSYYRGGKMICYALSVPQGAQPPDVDHGENYFLLAPAENDGHSEPEAIMGYSLKAGSMLEISVGNRRFSMAPKGKTAWVADVAREPELVEALRTGSQMVLKAVSARGKSWFGLSEQIGAFR